MVNSQNINAKGDIAESIVAKAAKELKCEASVIRHVWHCSKNSPQDRQGIDILIFLEGGLCLPIQVKSSYRRLHRHHRVHPYIKHVIVVEDSQILLYSDPNSEKYRTLKKDLIRQSKLLIKKAVREAFYELSRHNP